MSPCVLYYSLLIQDEFSESALNTACGHGHVDTASLLIRKGADINYKTKVWCIRYSAHVVMYLSLCLGILAVCFQTAKLKSAKISAVCMYIWQYCTHTTKFKSANTV